jgi:hypothetical protein
VSCSAAEFKRAIAANGYRAQPDSKRVRMLRTISKVRPSLNLACAHVLSAILSLPIVTASTAAHLVAAHDVLADPARPYPFS